MAGAAPPPAVLDGHLWKRRPAGLLAGFHQRRRVTLQNAQLVWRTPGERGTQRGSIDFVLNDCEVISDGQSNHLVVRPSTGKWECADFTGAAWGREFHFDVTGSEHQRDAWVRAINEHIRHGRALHEETMRKVRRSRAYNSEAAAAVLRFKQARSASQGKGKPSTKEEQRRARSLEACAAKGSFSFTMECTPCRRQDTMKKARSCKMARSAEFRLSVSRPADQPLGLIIEPLDDTLLINEVGPGVVADWNRHNPGAEIRSGDFIVAVNGFRGQGAKLQEECKSSLHLELAINRRLERRHSERFTSNTKPVFHKDPRCPPQTT